MEIHKYKNIQCQMYMNPTLGKEVGEIKPTQNPTPRLKRRRKVGGWRDRTRYNNEVKHWVRE